MLLGAAPAFAEYPPARTTVTVDETVTAAGKTVTLHFDGHFAVGEPVTITLSVDGGEVNALVLTVPVAESVTLTIPPSTSAGLYMLRVLAPTKDGGTITQVTPLMVDPDAPFIAADGSVIAAGDASTGHAALGAARSTQVKGLQQARPEGPGQLVASERTPAAIRYAGLTLLGLLFASGLGAIGYTALARLRR
jgi:hypothetical protein